MEKMSHSKLEKYEEIERLLPFKVETVRSTLQDKYRLVIQENCSEFISRCLRTKDGNIEKTIILIISFHTAVREMQHWSIVLEPSYYRDFYNTTAVIPLVKRDSFGRRVFIFRAETWDPQKISFDEAFACVWMMGQFVNAENIDTQRQGSVTIIDFANFTMKQFIAVNPWKIAPLSKWANNGVMGRLKSFHIVNHARLVSALYNTIRPFVKEKIRKRIHFHNNPKDLFEHVDAASLPKFLGGELDIEECFDKHFVQDFLKNDRYFNEMLLNGIPNK